MHHVKRFSTCALAWWLGVSGGCEGDEGAAPVAQQDSVGGKTDVDDEQAVGAGQRFAPVDLAFLLPPMGGPGDEHLTLDDATTDDAVLLTRAQLAALSVPGGFQTDTQSSAVSDIDDLYGAMFVTGVRFAPASEVYVGDPAEASARVRQPNSAELRFVVQAWGRGGVRDAALHLVYKIPDANVPAVLSAFARIKNDCQAKLNIDTNSHTVGVHPCLKSGDRGYMSFIGSQLLPHANPDWLAGVTSMMTFGRTWSFAFFSNRGGSLELVPLDAVETLSGVPARTDVVEQLFSGDSSRDSSLGFPDFVNDPLSSVSFGGESYLLADMHDIRNTARNEDTNTRDLDERRARAATIATLAQNPRHTSIADLVEQQAGINCVSCHTQGAVLEKLNFELDADAAYAKLDEQLNCDRPPGTDTRNPGPSQANVLQLINFGFRSHAQEDTDYAVNGRTVNEACDVAHYVNQEMLSLLE